MGKTLIYVWGKLSFMYGELSFVYGENFHLCIATALTYV